MIVSQFSPKDRGPDLLDRPVPHVWEGGGQSFTTTTRSPHSLRTSSSSEVKIVTRPGCRTGWLVAFASAVLALPQPGPKLVVR
jgi:hypothetical protein